jgi:hypothetical protein
MAEVASSKKPTRQAGEIARWSQVCVLGNALSSPISICLRHHSVSRQVKRLIDPETA